ncbi:nitroimidazol reductase NimA-like FMN-containing flavoprotein (pyridoxamine 5'-phosphate oxidase superfamily) [Nakamurella sp. UYEF19]|uniref:pyridoxamine 5'-phosphate oxidase family protein n=1 Tax=Nakamurella sp. UYEF19 TaxID=1756392 RepID=UPI00339654E9
MTTSALPIDHSGLEMIPMVDCLNRLRSARMGRLAFFSDGYPMILPINHGMDGDSIVFRTAQGSKLAAAENEMPVAYEIDGTDVDRRAGWSVLVRGEARTVDNPGEVDRLNRLGVWPFADAVERTHWVRISTSEITGRKIVLRR